MDAVARLVPGVLGNEESHQRDSFSDGLLEAPHYTRPVEWRGARVPDVLMSGHHGEIEKWRRKEGLRRTLKRRPDLLNLLTESELSPQDTKLLAQLREELEVQS
jgi:tRNA (guanine37-N1)-methyltransferase